MRLVLTALDLGRNKLVGEIDRFIMAAGDVTLNQGTRRVRVNNFFFLLETR